MFDIYLQRLLRIPKDLSMGRIAASINWKYIHQESRLLRPLLQGWIPTPDPGFKLGMEITVLNYLMWLRLKFCMNRKYN